MGDLATVGRGPDLRAEATLGQGCAGALGVDPSQQLRQPRCPLRDQVVVRAEGVEHEVPVGEQVLPALAGEPDRVGKDPQGEGCGQSGYRVELRPGENRVDQVACVGEPLLPQPAHCLLAENLRQDLSGGVVPRRVGLQQNAGRSGRCVVAEAARPHAGGGGELLPVDQCGAHVFVAGHRVEVVAGQIHHRPGVAELGVECVRILQDVVSERIDIRCRQRPAVVDGGGHRLPPFLVVTVLVRGRGPGGRCRSGRRR